MARPQSSDSERPRWEGHWELLGRRRLFGSIATFVRKQFLARAVRRYADAHFARSGHFVEAGCGTGESSQTLQGGERDLIGLDFSLRVLSEADTRRRFQHVVCADIRNLPFRNNSLAGVWNLGVMEHFTPEECDEILTEFRRSLFNDASTLLLFWPPTFGLSHLALRPLEVVRSLFSGRPFRFFPDEVNRLRSRREATSALGSAGFQCLAVHFPALAVFSHLVIVARPRDS